MWEAIETARGETGIPYEKALGLLVLQMEALKHQGRRQMKVVK